MSGTGPMPFGAQSSLTLAGYSPAGTSKVSPVKVKLTPANGAQTVNLTALPGGNQIGSLVTVYVDNSAGPVPVQLSYPDTGMVTVVPAFSQGFFPALTAGLVFVVSAPLIGVLNQAFGVTVQALNFAVPQASYGPFLPNENAGVLLPIGTAGGWQTLAGTAPFDAGAARLFQSLEIDSSSYGAQVAISGTSIDGGAWTVTQLPLQRGELVIPPTASGTAISTTATLPLGGNTTAIIPTRWRVQAIGEQTSYGLPLYMPWLPFSYTSMAAGLTTQGAFPAEAGFGVYLDKISVTASGWSSQFNVTVQDTGYASPYTLLEETFPSGNVTFGESLGYLSYKRNAAINIVIQNASAATGVLVISMRGALIAASQNG